jgi:site-specific DNA recombinase
MANRAQKWLDRPVRRNWPMANRAAPNSNRASAKLRCAIYTRKSSEEGLEQGFNSLDAQREACEAFIASQKREGWVLVGEMYDDGGFSGGTMERPAFQRLLSEVSAGKIDVVVVYKVDRLTRSLSDFVLSVASAIGCPSPPPSCRSFNIPLAMP